MNVEVPSEYTRLAINKDRALAYIEWLARARPGWHREYHYGYLGRDREVEPLVQMLGSLFWVAHLAGLVLLVQKADPEAKGQCFYFAYRTAVPMRAGMRITLERLIHDIVAQP